MSKGRRGGGVTMQETGLDEDKHERRGYTREIWMSECEHEQRRETFRTSHGGRGYMQKEIEGGVRDGETQRGWDETGYELICGDVESRQHERQWRQQ